MAIIYFQQLTQPVMVRFQVFGIQPIIVQGEIMNIDREKILSELESHISRTAQVMRQTAMSDHAALHANAEIWLESMETDIRLLRRLFEDFDLVEKLNDES